MPHDKNGKLVKEGDHVTVEFIVKSITPSEEFCNATMESVIPMLPSGGPATMTINAGQCELVSEEASDLPGVIHVSIGESVREAVQEGIEEIKRHVSSLIKPNSTFDPQAEAEAANGESSPADFKQSGIAPTMISAAQFKAVANAPEVIDRGIDWLKLKAGQILKIDHNKK